MTELHQTIQTLSANAHPMTSNYDTKLILSKSNSHDAIGEVQALVTELITDSEVD